MRPKTQAIGSNIEVENQPPPSLRASAFNPILRQIATWGAIGAAWSYAGPPDSENVPSDRPPPTARAVQPDSPKVWTHADLEQTNWLRNPLVQESLEKNQYRLQGMSEGYGRAVRDSYEVVLRLPEGVTKEQLVDELASDLNRVANYRLFNDVNVFSHEEGTTDFNALSGAVYEIDIFGPANGAVMLVDRRPDSFVFHTLSRTAAGKEAHPECGVRAFGFEDRDDGSVVFYTRGVSRPRSLDYVPDFLNGTARSFAQTFQEVGWTSLMRGVGQEVVRRGGAVEGMNLNPDHAVEQNESGAESGELHSQIDALERLRARMKQLSLDSAPTESFAPEERKVIAQAASDFSASTKEYLRDVRKQALDLAKKQLEEADRAKLAADLEHALKETQAAVDLAAHFVGLLDKDAAREIRVMGGLE